MKLLKQHNLKYIGPFVHVVYQTLPLMGALSMAFTATTMYGVWKPVILSYLPFMNLFLFLFIMAALGLFVMVLVYKYVYLGLYDFQNSQQFSEQNQMYAKIRAIIREEIDKEVSRR